MSRRRNKPSTKKTEDGRTSSSKGLFAERGRWVVGIHACREVLSVRPESVLRLCLKRGWEDSQQLEKFGHWAKNQGLELQEGVSSSFDRFCSGNQGVALCVREGEPSLDWDHLKVVQKSTLLAIDGVEDPHNLGAILRTAWLFGVHGVFIPQDRAVGLTPSVCKVASGGTEHIAVERVKSFSQLFKELQQFGYWIYGLAEGVSQPLYHTQFAAKSVIVVGAEHKGIRLTTSKICDLILSIPQVEAGSSYNASVATALCLGENYRQMFCSDDPLP